MYEGRIIVRRLICEVKEFVNGNISCKQRVFREIMSSSSSCVCVCVCTFVCDLLTEK